MLKKFFENIRFFFLCCVTSSYCGIGKTCLKPIWFVANDDLSIFIYFYVGEFVGVFGLRWVFLVVGEGVEVCCFIFVLAYVADWFCMLYR